MPDLPEKVMDVLPKRFAKYGLTLHPEKTRLLEFGRCAMGKAKRQVENLTHLLSSDLHISVPRAGGNVNSTCEDDE
jgi:hypothetical protein